GRGDRGDEDAERAHHAPRRRGRRCAGPTGRHRERQPGARAARAERAVSAKPRGAGRRSTRAASRPTARRAGRRDGRLATPSRPPAGRTRPGSPGAAARGGATALPPRLTPSWLPVAPWYEAKD